MSCDIRDQPAPSQRSRKGSGEPDIVRSGRMTLLQIVSPDPPRNELTRLAPHERVAKAPGNRFPLELARGLEPPTG